ncbi:uncharacterized protein DNG_03141 [Cephalotrichum gorgonifer]|uniref:Uncharacterized protein n=1 Tax=Cephalotrichum gorgonifer TaxID=2041049 RepID=A0AAE8MTP0_9PEZI|nr:uncharacterized protein DNG_03141 [Cephalotrichum gorgonifer]
MAADPQLQSAFITRLPREIRDRIYLELWRPCGLRQHIFWHWHSGKADTSHFYRWPCTTEFHPEDPVQKDVEALRSKLGIPVGETIWDETYAPRLRSSWQNHWACYERGEEFISGGEVGDTYDVFSWYIDKGCWTEHPCYAPRHSPYIPMLLSCKVVSSECLQSIYSSTTFIFTELQCLQFFVGYCQKPVNPKLDIQPTQPPAFFKYARKLELSLPADFPVAIPCVVPELSKQEHLHDVYDFHWLWLDKFHSLSSVKIWIASRKCVSDALKRKNIV